ncbi:MAG TPA: hypothetical protein VN714_00100 [Trebonia sp.]|nr:hypothetical protein [Trebonia sp.]
MLTAGGTLVNDHGDAIARDPEVREARTIAEAARTRLVSCVSRPEDGIDLTEAQRMLDALRDAQDLAGDAEDRVLVHRGLLTSAEASKRAAGRRPAATPREAPARTAAARRTGPRMNVARVIAGALVLVVLGVVGATLAQRFGVRLPLARR